LPIRLVQRLPAPPGDDHRVAEIVEAMGQRLADSRPATGDQDGVAGALHRLLSPDDKHRI
jgi:hypothetical protein